MSIDGTSSHTKSTSSGGVSGSGDESIPLSSSGGGGTGGGVIGIGISSGGSGVVGGVSESSVSVGGGSAGDGGTGAVGVGGAGGGGVGACGGDGAGATGAMSVGAGSAGVGDAVSLLHATKSASASNPTDKVAKSQTAFKLFFTPKKCINPTCSNQNSPNLRGTLRYTLTIPNQLASANSHLALLSAIYGRFKR